MSSPVSAPRAAACITFRPLARGALLHTSSVRSLRRNTFFLHSRVVGRTNGDFPETLAPVVLPGRKALPSGARIHALGRGAAWPSAAALAGSRWRLLVSPGGATLLAVYLPRHDREGHPVIPEANMAYHFRTHRFWGNGWYDNSGNIQGISPFMLIGPGDEPDPGDVAAICKALESFPSAFEEVGLPDLGGVLSSTKSENSAVRQAAAQMLGSYWVAAKLAIPALEGMRGHDSNLRVRVTAAVSLVRLRKLMARHRSDLKWTESLFEEP